MSATINRSLTNIRTELEFLQEEGVITDALYQHLVESLPQKYTKGMAPQGVKAASTVIAKVLVSDKTSQELSEKLSTTSISEPAAPPAQKAGDAVISYCEVLYDYEPQQPDDLRLRRGDKIAVLEHLSEDWWRGKVSSSSQEGVFPSSYVKMLSDSTSPAKVAAPLLQYQNNQYTPPPQQFQGYQQQQPYYPPQQYQQPPPQQYQQPLPQQVVVEQPAQQEGSHNGAFKRFGSKLGNAAIFGAGATIGGDIVNSIF
ncbi:hypothetical protein BABINDRAFT_41597 [Babjeviella inositovora NRRL Y-12698]|uniref:SH3 domain-containing protein n=1 Tax=Babjeviella inositovora NRRL Y-12698 TaxID=984486 RepID=A0A1E3QIL9_9ASCO|nr:uncharacterized protein BABINDRAFT_41597 [Babjeviella inositovora NRRL Y-12698]ODQ77541.1 hypothetical protein BABINDRAFT_41597 [Babjeviella inositovora NRRL Y-12698]